VFPLSLLSLSLTGNSLSDAHLNSLLLSFPPPPQATLSHLILGFNQLTSLPPSLQDHSALRELQCTNNKITSLQWMEWHQMTRLETLDLSNNLLTTELVRPLLSLSSIHSLNLDNNELKDIPPEFSLLPHLRFLGLYGNPQKSIRTTILQQGTDAVIQLLRMRLTDDQLRVAENPSSSSTTTTTTTQGDIQRERQRDSGLDRMRAELEVVERRLQDKTLSEASRFGLKKDMATKRANILKLTRKLESEREKR